MCGFPHILFLEENMSMLSMNPPEPREDETMEDLQLQGLRLLQKKTGFRFGMDSVLLADFAAVRPQDRVADFGTGSGVLPLLLFGRGKGSEFHGIEIQPEMAEMAERTMRINRLEDRVRIYTADAGRAWELFEPCSIDAVVCNPPYGRTGASLKNPLKSRAVARHQEEDTLAGFFISAFRILKGKGKISLVYPAEQMLALMEGMRQAGLEPKRFRLVYPFADKPANLALVEGIKDAKPLLQPMPPLIIYKQPGVLTNELKSVYDRNE